MDDLPAELWLIRGKFYLIQHVKEMCACGTDILPVYSQITRKSRLLVQHIFPQAATAILTLLEN